MILYSKVSSQKPQSFRLNIECFSWPCNSLPNCKNRKQKHGRNDADHKLLYVLIGLINLSRVAGGLLMVLVLVPFLFPIARHFRYRLHVAT